VDADPPRLPDSFSAEFRDFISICVQKDEINRPESTTLISHPWLTKYDNDGINVKEWLAIYTSK